MDADAVARVPLPSARSSPRSVTRPKWSGQATPSRTSSGEAITGGRGAGTADAAFLADSQVPWNVAALGGVVTEPAWRSKPAFSPVTTDDHMIPPPAQRTMTARVGAVTTDAIGSRAVYVSQPGAVADLIRQAANTDR